MRLPLSGRPCGKASRVYYTCSTNGSCSTNGKRHWGFLNGVHIGHIKLDGKLDENDGKVDARWDVEGMYVWQRNCIL